jgi:hypothetical protein
MVPESQPGRKVEDCKFTRSDISRSQASAQSSGMQPITGRSLRRFGRFSGRRQGQPGRVTSSLARSDMTLGGRMMSAIRSRNLPRRLSLPPTSSLPVGRCVIGYRLSQHRQPDENLFTQNRQGVNHWIWALNLPPTRRGTLQPSGGSGLHDESRDRVRMLNDARRCKAL